MLANDMSCLVIDCLQAPFVHVEEIVSNHWKSYGRNYYRCGCSSAGTARWLGHSIAFGLFISCLALTHALARPTNLKSAYTPMHPPVHSPTLACLWLSRYDYEGVDSAAAASVLNHLRSQFAALPGTVHGEFTVRKGGRGIRLFLYYSFDYFPSEAFLTVYLVVRASH